MLAPILLLALASPQNVQHLFAVDETNSLVDWEVNTSIGGVNESPDKFKLNGTINLKLDATQAPFTLGQFDGALLVTIPEALYGEIPNPIPFLPPLATFDLVGLQATVTSSVFSINPATGAFTAVVTLHTTAGSNTLGGLFGSGTEPAFGTVSLPTSITGTITQTGGNLDLLVNLDVLVTDDLSGITVSTHIFGPINADAAVAAANASTLTVPVPLTVGAFATFSVNNLNPGATAWLAGTFDGTGSTPIPQLGITLNLANPAQIGAPTVASGAGNAFWTLVIPAVVAGRSVWFQALQNGLISQVAGTYSF